MFAVSSHVCKAKDAQILDIGIALLIAALHEP